MAMRPGDIKYVAIEGGALDGHWYPTEWLRDARRGERAGGAVFRPTGELATKHVPTSMKDPVTQETITVQMPQMAYVYREILKEDRRRDPRTRFLCPVCPAEELADGRFRNKVYTAEQLEKHMAKHMEEDPEGVEYALGEGAPPGSTVEYASQDVGLASVGEGQVAGFAPGGVPLAPPVADPMESIAEALGITPEEVKRRLLSGGTEPAPSAEVAPGTEVPIQEAPSGAEEPQETAVIDVAPDPQAGGDSSEAPQKGAGDEQPAKVGD